MKTHHMHEHDHEHAYDGACGRERERAHVAPVETGRGRRLAIACVGLLVLGALTFGRVAITAQADDEVPPPPAAEDDTKSDERADETPEKPKEGQASSTPAPTPPDWAPAVVVHVRRKAGQTPAAASGVGPVSDPRAAPPTASDAAPRGRASLPTPPATPPATPNVATPNVATPNTATPNAATPNAATPNAATPNVATPNAATPSSSAPAGVSPESDPFRPGPLPRAPVVDDGAWIPGAPAVGAEPPSLPAAPTGLAPAVRPTPAEAPRFPEPPPGMEPAAADPATPPALPVLPDEGMRVPEPPPGMEPAIRPDPGAVPGFPEPPPGMEPAPPMPGPAPAAPFASEPARVVEARVRPAVTGGPAPPRPSPPRWDPRRDVKVRIGPDGRRVVVPAGEPCSVPVEPTPGSLAGPQPGTVPPRREEGVWVPGAPYSGDAPPAVDPRVGGSDLPLPLPPDGMASGGRPGEGVGPAPAAPVMPAPGVPADEGWLPGSGSTPAPAVPAPEFPAPASPPGEAPSPWPPSGDAVAPAPGPGPAVPVAPENPWVPAPGTSPASPGGPGLPAAPAAPAPTPNVPVPSVPAVPEPPDPVQPTPQPPPAEMNFPTPAADAKEHVNRLLQSPGNPRIMGYPPAILTRADAAVALEGTHRPAVLLFYDNESRSSDLQAAEFLPLLVKYTDRVDVIPIDVNASNSWTPAERKLIRKYYMAVVPTTVVLAGDRSPLLLKFQRISVGTLEAILDKATGR